MDIFSVFTLCGGLAFFLYGMQVMSSGLEKIAGGKLEKLLKKMTDNPVKSLTLGAGITIAVQSSSALTVMLVGLVNSGIMSLGQTIGVIMGSNVGTTLTAWILSLSGIESDNFFLRLLKPESFSPVFALVGILLLMVAKSNRKKSMGSIFLGFAVLMYGMELMTNAMSPLADMPEFAGILTAFTNPLLGVAVGAIFTGIIQSSAASVGILQALSLTGGLTYGMSIPIIMGQNIGTCVTAILSSIGVNTNAKRVAAVHISFNIIGSLVCLMIFYFGNKLVHFAFIDTAVNPVGIAFVHTIFNVATTMMLLPFTKQLERLAIFLVKEKSPQDKLILPENIVLLDDRLLLAPSFAISECLHHSSDMADYAHDNIIDSIDLLSSFDAKKADEINKNEQKLDMYEDKLGTFLVKISGKELSDSDSSEVSKMLHTIGDFERIGDHAVNIVKVAAEMNGKNIHFSEHAVSEINTIVSALREILDLTVESFDTDNTSSATKVEPLEQVIDGLIAEVKNRHIRRLQAGKCTIELGFMLSDLLNCFERVSDHCSNIAACIIQLKVSAMDKHIYLNDVKTSGSEEFTREFDNYKSKYVLREQKSTTAIS